MSFYFNGIVDMSLFHFSHCFSVVRDDITLGSLGNDDGDSNENGKNPKVQIGKTTTLHVHHAF